MPQTGRKGSCYLLAVHLLGFNTVLFYAYDGHFYLALSTFSLLAIDDSIFLNLRWIPHLDGNGPSLHHTTFSITQYTEEPFNSDIYTSPQLGRTFSIFLFFT